MRKMKDLFTENERVWFYITSEWQQDFYEELISLKARFMNGEQIQEGSIGSMMGVGRDGTTGYISNLVWYYSFFSSGDVFVKVDYGKYRSGAGDFLIMIPNVRPVSFEKKDEERMKF